VSFGSAVGIKTEVPNYSVLGARNIVVSKYLFIYYTDIASGYAELLTKSNTKETLLFS
jgi:hypothetical protein